MKDKDVLTNLYSIHDQALIPRECISDIIEISTESQFS